MPALRAGTSCGPRQVQALHRCDCRSVAGLAAGVGTHRQSRRHLRGTCSLFGLGASPLGRSAGCARLAGSVPIWCRPRLPLGAHGLSRPVNFRVISLLLGLALLGSSPTPPGRNNFLESGWTLEGGFTAAWWLRLGTGLFLEVAFKEESRFLDFTDGPQGHGRIFGNPSTPFSRGAPGRNPAGRRLFSDLASPSEAVFSRPTKYTTTVRCHQQAELGSGRGALWALWALSRQRSGQGWLLTGWSLARQDRCTPGGKGA